MQRITPNGQATPPFTSFLRRLGLTFSQLFAGTLSRAFKVSHGSILLQDAVGVAHPPPRRLTSSAIVGIDSTLSSTTSAPALTASSTCPGPIAALKITTETPGLLLRSSPIRSLPPPSGNTSSITATSNWPSPPSASLAEAL